MGKCFAPFGEVEKSNCKVEMYKYSNEKSLIST